MNEVHIDLSRAEIERIDKVTTYIAHHDFPIGGIKKMFRLTDVEYETMMDLAMPVIRERGSARQQKRVYLNFLRRMQRILCPEEDLPLKYRGIVRTNHLSAEERLDEARSALAEAITEAEKYGEEDDNAADE